MSRASRLLEEIKQRIVKGDDVKAKAAVEKALGQGLLLEHYERLESQYQALVPLRKVYIPVPPGYTTGKEPQK